MKTSFLIIFCILIAYSAKCQVNWGQISFGYIPTQKSSVNDKGDALTADLTWWQFNEDRFFTWGYGGGAGIRSYRKLPNNILNSDDPFKTSLTRFDVHVGPAIALGPPLVRLVVSPQAGLWYAGTTASLSSPFIPHVNFTVAATADLVIARYVSLGVTYRATSLELVTGNGDYDDPTSSYISIKPAWEFHIGLNIPDD